MSMSETTRVFKTLTWELLAQKYNKQPSENVKDKYWWVNKVKVKPLMFSHPTSCMFITGFTAKAILALLNDEDRALILGIHYSPKLMDRINLFFLAPEIIQKAYIDAGVPKRAHNDIWHITALLSDDNKSLRLTRKDSEDFLVELSNRNFYQRLEIPEDRKNELLEMIAANQAHKIQEAVEKVKSQGF